jgi:hypothetical protein
MKAFFSFIFLFSCFFSAQAQCTSWQTNLNQFGPNAYHYKDVNTAETLDGTKDLILTGTRFSTSFNTAELFAARISGTDGTRVWIKTYTNIQAARGFDVTVFMDGASQERLAITGYINDGGPLNKAYIAVLDTANGNIIQDEAYEINPIFHAQGLNIIYTERDFNGVSAPGFMVAGYTTGNYDPFAAGNTEAFVLRTDAALAPLFTTIISSPTAANSDYDMANEIIETSDGYFVTGSVNEDAGNRQGVLVVKLDDQGALVWQNNYIYGNDQDKGVDAYYDANTNQIFLLTYYSVNHYFGFTVINNTTGSIDPVRSYAYQNPSELNRTGFKIMPSNNPSFPNDLLILGYQRDGDVVEPDNTITMGNSIPFAITVDRFSGAVNRFRTYPVPYKDPTNYTDNFRFWDGISPLIYHPEIGYPVATGSCYMMVGNRSFGNARTAIEAFTLSGNLNNECLQDDLVINLVNFAMTPETVTTSNITTSLSTLSFTVQSNSSESGNCETGGTLATSVMNVPEINIFPIPASEILRVENLVSQNSNYQIFDSSGKVIQTDTISQNEINISTLRTGIYFIKISEGSTTTIKKFIKK